MVVSGPVATSVISVPGEAAISETMKSTACLPHGPGGPAPAALAPPRPDSPCTWPAPIAWRSSGAAHLAVTGTSAAPTGDATARAFAVKVLASSDVRSRHGGDPGEVDSLVPGRERDRERVVDPRVCSRG